MDGGIKTKLNCANEVYNNLLMAEII